MCVCVRELFWSHLWPRLGLITMTKASKPSRDLASVVEVGPQRGEVHRAQWEPALEVNSLVN